MKRQIILLITSIFIIMMLPSTVSALGAQQTSTTTFNLTMQVSGGNVSTPTLEVQATNSEWALGNITSAEFSILVGFLYTTNSTFNGSTNVTVPVVCVETWQCTGWVTNGTLQYRTCTQISACLTEDNKPPETQLFDEFFMAVAILIGSVMIFTYKASQELEERHWIIKMMLYYGTLAMGWAAVNVALRMAEDRSPGSTIVTGLEIFYEAYTTVGVILVFYLGFRFFTFTFEKLRGIAVAVTGKKNEEEDEQAW